MEKDQVRNKDRPIKITFDFSIQSVKARSACKDTLQILRCHDCLPRLLYSAKVSIIIDGDNKTVYD